MPIQRTRRHDRYAPVFGVLVQVESVARCPAATVGGYALRSLLPCVSMAFGHQDDKERQSISRLFVDGEWSKQRPEQGTDSFPCPDDSMRSVARNPMVPETS